MKALTPDTIGLIDEIAEAAKNIENLESALQAEKKLQKNRLQVLQANLQLTPQAGQASQKIPISLGVAVLVKQEKTYSVPLESFTIVIADDILFAYENSLKDAGITPKDFLRFFNVKITPKLSEIKQLGAISQAVLTKSFGIETTTDAPVITSVVVNNGN